MDSYINESTEIMADYLRVHCVRRCTMIHNGIVCIHPEHNQIIADQYNRIRDCVRTLGGDLVVPPKWSGNQFDIQFIPPATTLENLRELWKLTTNITGTMDLPGLIPVFRKMGLVVHHGRLCQVRYEPI